MEGPVDSLFTISVFPSFTHPLATWLLHLNNINRIQIDLALFAYVFYCKFNRLPLVFAFGFFILAYFLLFTPFV